MNYVIARRAVIGAGLAWPFTFRAARAHAILEASTPVLNGSIAAGQQRIMLRFNSRIDRARSSLLLTRPDKSRAGLGIDPEGPPEILTASAELTPGAHMLRWQVLALDGHITRGAVPFMVVG